MKKKSNYMEKVNKEFKKEFGEYLILSYDVEDYSEEDMIEYGIANIEDTAKFNIILFDKDWMSGTILISYEDVGRVNFASRDYDDFKRKGIDGHKVMSILKSKSNLME